MPTKASRELYQLERFLPRLFEGKSYSLAQPGPPLPDAVIEVSGRKIGIEITALVIDKSGMKRERNQELILNEAQRIFQEEYPLALGVSVNFINGANWEKLNRSQIASILINTVKKCIAQAEEFGQIHSDFRIVAEKLHSHIRSVTVYSFKGMTTPCWSADSSFWVPEVPAEKVQETITDKGQRISGYLSGCDEVWLLMLENGSPSTYYDGFEKLQAKIFKSDFAQTFIGRIPNGELLTLQTT